MLQLGKVRELLYFGWLHCLPERVGSHLRIPWGVLVKLPKLHAFVPRQWLHAGRLGSYVCRVAVPALATAALALTLAFTTTAPHPTGAAFRSAPVATTATNAAHSTHVTSRPIHRTGRESNAAAASSVSIASCDDDHLAAALAIAATLDQSGGAHSDRQR